MALEEDRLASPEPGDVPGDRGDPGSPSPVRVAPTYERDEARGIDLDDPNFDPALDCDCSGLKMPLPPLWLPLLWSVMDASLSVNERRIVISSFRRLFCIDSCF
mmetsp:Transcript_41169/g.109899  ORF Transcript_41169/g.109899 Transcript_41169/m.109899 type:complete len:104 (-) Transcript_41169:1511-1822(-)